jgi:serine/threonine protein kinase
VWVAPFQVTGDRAVVYSPPQASIRRTHVFVDPNQLREIFDEAVGLPIAERSAFLRRIGEQDAALRHEVERLLDAAVVHGSIFDTHFDDISEDAGDATDGRRLALAPGARLGPYEILSKLGSGGMGEVYSAQDTRLDRTVAVKVLPQELIANPTARQRFEREARALAALAHPNICPLFDVGREHDVDYLVMQYVDGETLAARLARGKLPLDQALSYAMAIADALIEAHRNDIVHRDLKPSNIMLTPDGPKLVDFGLAKRPIRAATADVGQSEPITRTGVVLGTVQYMSPEQLEDRGIDERTDIFGFGLVLYEMITGRRAFDGDSDATVIGKILHTNPPAPSFVDPITPRALDELVGRCLAKNPDSRFQSFIAVKERLLATLGLLRAAASDAPPILSRSNFIPARLSVFVVAVLLIGGTALGWRRLARTEDTRLLNDKPVVQRHLTRLTFDAGLQTDATFSPDSRFIAYAADHGGNFDIWVQTVGGSGDPLRVTKSPAVDLSPDWSINGEIVFRSERDGGGLFVVSALGGPERRLTTFGVRPKWSPDGSRVLFMAAEFGPRPGVYVANLDGSAPRRVLERFSNQLLALSAVAWHPDGRRISLLGHTAGDKTPALYTVPLDGGAAIRTSIPEPRAVGVDFAWVPSGDALLLEMSVNNLSNMWRLQIRPETLEVGAVTRLTTGAGQDRGVAVSRDGTRLAFTIKTESLRLWSYPFDATTGRITGPSKPATDPAGTVPFNAALAPDGRHLAYGIRGVGTGRLALWTEDLLTGKRRLLARDDFSRTAPVWSRDSKRLAYQWRRALKEGGGEGTIAVNDVSGEDEHLLGQPSREIAVPSAWSPDSHALLVSSFRSAQPVALKLWRTAAAPHADKTADQIAGDPTYDTLKSDPSRTQT